MHYHRGTCFNDTISGITFSGEADPIVEPVLLDDTKRFLRISGNSDNTDVTNLIKAAREWVEKMTGLSLIPRKVTCTVQVNEGVELPYGPVSGEVKNSNDINVAYTVTPGPFPEFNLPGQYTVIYEAGYTAAAIPENLKFAIMARVGATYENRGDKDEANYSQMAKSYYRPYRRLRSWL